MSEVFRQQKFFTDWMAAKGYTWSVDPERQHLMIQEYYNEALVKAGKVKKQELVTELLERPAVNLPTCSCGHVPCKNCPLEYVEISTRTGPHAIPVSFDCCQCERHWVTR